MLSTPAWLIPGTDNRQCIISLASAARAPSRSRGAPPTRARSTGSSWATSSAGGSGAGAGQGAGQGAESSPSSFSSVPMAGLPLAGAMMGLCLGGPVGVLAGAKLGGVAALGGSILGYTGAMVIKEQRELRSYIDDHYKQVQYSAVQYSVAQL